MVKRYVVALGGNAILTDDPTAQAQEKALETTAHHLVKLIKAGHELVVTHGNGPQVGNLLLQQLGSDSEKNPAMPLDTVGAMTQGEIGYWMSKAFTKAFKENGIENKAVAALVTRTVVDKADPAFQNPTKPIGPFYDENQKNEMQEINPTWVFVEDSGRGYRRVVPSPIPSEIVESQAVQALVESGALTIASGGGGIPVAKENGLYEGVEAVIDKDFSAAKLAQLVNADDLLILTAVDNVYVNYNKENQEKLEKVTIDQMKTYIEQGQFAAGSMLPKVQAALSFVEMTGKSATITSLENLGNFLETGSGTTVVPN
ncbi:MAG: carbamate kinase [Streptococcaceae bacterium]|nr:carbamate kinase [Streptococcaceae bacterium]